MCPHAAADGARLRCRGHGSPGTARPHTGHSCERPSDWWRGGRAACDWRRRLRGEDGATKMTIRDWEQVWCPDYTIILITVIRIIIRTVAIRTITIMSSWGQCHQLLVTSHWPGSRHQPAQTNTLHLKELSNCGI